MTRYDIDSSGAPVCADCSVGQCRPDELGCWAQWCQCMCRATARAAEVDDRPDAALANLARDIERENRATVTELMAERFGRST